MCRTAHAMASSVICGLQMLVRSVMTVYLMLEDSIKTLLQTLFNFVSFLFQMVALIPISMIFLLSSRLKCFMCGAGGPFSAAGPGGPCDCMMSALALILLYFVFSATGVMDKIYYSLGYAKAAKPVSRYVATPGDVTECSRNDTETTIIYIDDDDTTPTDPTTKLLKLLRMSPKVFRMSLEKSKMSPEMSKKLSLTPKGSLTSLSTIKMGYSRFWSDLWIENTTWNYPDVYGNTSQGSRKTKLLYYMI